MDTMNSGNNTDQISGGMKEATMIMDKEGIKDMKKEEKISPISYKGFEVVWQPTSLTVGLFINKFLSISKEQKDKAMKEKKVSIYPSTRHKANGTCFVKTLNIAIPESEITKHVGIVQAELNKLAKVEFSANGRYSHRKENEVVIFLGMKRHLFARNGKIGRLVGKGKKGSNRFIVEFNDSALIRVTPSGRADGTDRGYDIVRTGQEKR